MGNIMGENLKIRVFENCCINGKQYKNALGFTHRLETNFKSELYAVPLEKNGENTILFMYGGGGIRQTVRESFKVNLGDESPIFDQAFEIYRNKGELVKRARIK